MNTPSEPKQRVYKVAWRDGRPGIEIGEVVLVGKRKKFRRVHPKNRQKLEPIGDWSETIENALRDDLRDVVSYLRRHGEAKFSMADLESVCCRLRRLRVKLERHGLIT